MQELNQISLSKSVGKEIKAVSANTDKLLIVFTDKTFAFYQRYYEFQMEMSSDVYIKYERFVSDVALNMKGEPIISSTLKMFVDAGVIDYDTFISDAKDSIEAKNVSNKKRMTKRLKELAKALNVELKFNDKKYN